MLGHCLDLKGGAKEHSFWKKRCGLLTSSIRACGKVFQPGLKEFPRKASPEDLGREHPSFLSVALSLRKVAEAFNWAPALGGKGTPSTSAFGGKLWLSSSTRPWEVALSPTLSRTQARRLMGSTKVKPEQHHRC